MNDFDLFHFYRFLVSTLVISYGTVRLITSIWRWSGFGRDGATASAMMRHYVILLFVRIKLRRFLVEFGIIGALVAVLCLLLRLHDW